MLQIVPGMRLIFEIDLQTKLSTKKRKPQESVNNRKQHFFAEGASVLSLGCNDMS